MKKFKKTVSSETKQKIGKKNLNEVIRGNLKLNIKVIYV